MLATERKLWWPSSIISAPADRETSQVDGNNDRDSNNRTVLILNLGSKEKPLHLPPPVLTDPRVITSLSE
ncbi:predicted protein [Botrytis cinerea T4]|uniref:Uncharacterized protein n=1 Tax=Botryotinia fuckeliana (strain T4) TaxID=999810 RepID=G2YW57_BOTF4|nr:predicted protein [Botrytis cinerea T4]